MRKNKVWSPFPGAQRLFLNCPSWECLLHGNRGGGKTDVLLMDFLQEVGKGHGADYRGLLLREATTELGDVIAKSLKWIPRMFPTASFNKSRKIWTFEDGETLWLNYARTEVDYFQYHGHEYPWIGWEELTNHAVDTIYLKLMSCNRCSNSNVPIKYRATCNPSGPGHSWVKERFIDTVGEGIIYQEKQKIEYPDEHGDMIKATVTVSRTHIKSYAAQNKSLNADPTYIAKIHTLTQNDDMLRKAWIEGSWDLVSDSFFSDVWRRKIHIIPEFKLPKSWTIFRSFDWGSSRPWAVTYFAISNGEQPKGLGFYLPVGSTIIINEIYGWTGEANVGDRATSPQIAERTLELDKHIKNRYGIKVRIGPADTSIWEVRDGKSIGGSMVQAKLHWTRAYKGSGSRVAGWALIRQMLGSAKRKELENPHLYFFREAKHHIRTLPIMQRDPLKPEDIDTTLEDHCLDSLRYGLAKKLTGLKRKKVGN